MGALATTLKSTLPQTDASASSTAAEKMAAFVATHQHVALKEALAEYTRACHGRSSSEAVLRGVRGAMETAQVESSTEQEALDRMARILKSEARRERRRSKRAEGRALKHRGTR